MINMIYVCGGRKVELTNTLLLSHALLDYETLKKMPKGNPKRCNNIKTARPQKNKRKNENVIARPPPPQDPI